MNLDKSNAILKRITNKLLIYRWAKFGIGYCYGISYTGKDAKL